MFCLIPKYVDSFLKGLKSGEIDPIKLSKMESGDRNTYLGKYVGENAKEVNALFESKLLLKNQKQGYITWAKKVSGITLVTRRSLIDRIGRMDKILNPADEKAFLKDLASTKIGADISLEEAQKLGDLSSKVQDAKKDLIEDSTNQKKQIAYGERIFDIQQYLIEINPHKASILLNLAGIPRSLVASLDFVSAPFRHGFFSMSDPAWIKNYLQIPRLLMSEKAFRTRMGKIYGHPYYDNLIKGGLKIFQTGGELSKQEEQFASNLLDKFPITKGSKRAYTGFLNGLRMDLGIKLLKAAELRGDDISGNSKLVKNFSTMINNMTGAGSLGKFESAAPKINMGIFSARMQVARFNMLNPWTYLNPKTLPEARLFALKNLVGSLAISGILLGSAKMAGNPVTTNSNSTNFGEIKVGNLNIDTTGGNRTYITFLSRMLSGLYVSRSGKTTKLDIGSYKPLTRKDLVVSFAAGKVAPGLASVLADYLLSTQKTIQAPRMDAFGNKVDVPNELKKQLLPMNITNGMDMFEADPNNTALGIILGLFGLPVSTTKPK